MPPDPFDRAARYLIRHYPALLAWLLRLVGKQFDFVGWLDTQRIAFPGVPGRTCDTVAHLRNPSAGFAPWAVVGEAQTTPDVDMPARLMIYLGQVRLDLRPTEHPGDRFAVGAVVMNLTGKGSSSIDMHWPEAGLRALIEVHECDLSGLSAAKVLADVEAKTAPLIALALLPLMQGGGEDGMITRWKEVVGAVTDPRPRADLGLALTFAELTDFLDKWKVALEGWNVKESQVVKEWTREAREEGERKGERKGKVDAIQKLLEALPAVLPGDLVTALRGINDPARLDSLLLLAARANSLDQFRKDAGL